MKQRKREDIFAHPDFAGRQCLRIKIKSLAVESKMIRREAAKCKRYPCTVASLNSHRVNEVRNESRAALLAYGYLKGMKYREIENKAKSVPPMKRINSLVTKYGSYGVNKGLETWVV